MGPAVAVGAVVVWKARAVAQAPGAVVAEEEGWESKTPAVPELIASALLALSPPWQR
jgi:hypothetical protein